MVRIQVPQFWREMFKIFMNEREPQFIGRKYTKEEASEAVEAMEKWEKESADHMEGERDKTDFDLKIITRAQELLADELRIAGIEWPGIKIEKIHIFDGDSYKTRFNKSDDGFFRSIHGAICINLEKANTTAQYLATLLHEFVHAASAQKFYMDRGRIVYDARVGYRLRSKWKKDRMQDVFRGLNEFMTETVVYMILLRNAEKIKTEFSISPDEINGTLYKYMEYGETINAIIDKIASYTGKPSGEILGGFTLGLFKNTILKLKDIEKVFGKGSLRILALMGSAMDEEKDEQNRKLIEEFFTTEDKQKREELRGKILRVIESQRVDLNQQAST